MPTSHNSQIAQVAVILSMSFFLVIGAGLASGFVSIPGLPQAIVGSGNTVMNLHIVDQNSAPVVAASVVAGVVSPGGCNAPGACVTDTNGDISFYFTLPISGITLTKSGYETVSATLTASCSTCNYVLSMPVGSASISETMTYTQVHVIVKDSVTGAGITTASITAQQYSRFFAPTYTTNTAGDYYLGTLPTTLPQGSVYTITVAAPGYITTVVAPTLLGSPPTVYYTVNIVSGSTTTSTTATSTTSTVSTTTPPPVTTTTTTATTSTSTTTTAPTTSTTSTTTTTTTTQTTSQTSSGGGPSPFSNLSGSQWLGIGMIGSTPFIALAGRKQF